MVAELMSEMLHEITGDPVRFAAEVVQFGLLVAIVWVAAVGAGRRSGFVRNMLAERRQRVADRVRSAQDSVGLLEGARAQASAKMRTARTEARRIIGEAKRKAEMIEAEAHAEADAEAQRIATRAEEALATELAEMHVDIREQLVDLVAQATRSVMNERLTLAEQRHLIEGAVLASVDGDPTPPALEVVAAPVKGRRH